MATETAVAAQNKVLASTMQGIVPGLGLQVYSSFPLWDAIESKGNKKPWHGEAMRQPILNVKYKAAQNYTNYDEFNTIAQEPFTVVDYEMAGLGQTVTLAEMQMRKNQSDPRRLIELLVTETKAAVLSMKETMTTNLFASSNTSKGILSLNTLTDASTTIGGLSGSSTWGGTTTASGSFTTQGLSDMMTLKMSLGVFSTLDGKGAKGTDLIMTTPTIYRYMWAALQGQQRYAGTSADPALTLSFDGVKVAYDDNCTSGVIFMLNTDHLFLYVASGADFTVKPQVRPTNQDAFTSMILWNGQLGTDARRFLGKLTGVTA